MDNTEASTRDTLAARRAQVVTGMSGVKGAMGVQEDEVETDFWKEMDVFKLKTKELRAALEARGLDSSGNKKHLQARLLQSVQEEKEEELEFLAMAEAARRAEAALEESGSVYTAGLNRKGQLGLGDRTDRDEFVVVRELRGKGIRQVSAGGDMVLALSEDGNVYTWGGVGMGTALGKLDKKRRAGNPVRSKLNKNNLLTRKGKSVQFIGDDSASEGDVDEQESKDKGATSDVDEFGLAAPRLIESLQGEGIVAVDVGPNHCGAISDGGDLYMWGDGTRGQLGTGDYRVLHVPTLVQGLQDGKVVTQIAVGQTHTLCLLETHDVYSWGFCNCGKLGLGVTERKGVPEPKNKYFPDPVKIPAFAKVVVRLVAASANHCAAVTDSGFFTWGSGDGGRLGHGDCQDRGEPCLVESLKNSVVIDVSLGFWHSCAIVQVPPTFNGGWLYTWGSGYHGQLAQGDLTCCTEPELSQICVDMHLLFIRISSGPTHSFAMTVDGDLYSWGSDDHGELAREREYEIDKGEKYTPIPGFVYGFNTMVDRIGRGGVVSFSCGKNFTVVATSKYTGETEEEIRRREEEEDYVSDESEDPEAEAQAKRLAIVAEQNIDCDGKLCKECSECPGFEAHLFRPNMCKECNHGRKLHTVGPSSMYQATEKQ